jgi:hypothetical protein
MECGFCEKDFEQKVLYARGGGSIGALKDFLQDARQSDALSADLLVVGSDANCKGFVECRKQIEGEVTDTPYPALVAAIPDPHVERWFLLDPPALETAAETKLKFPTVKYKCEKNRYKTILREILLESGVVPPLGGLEFGPLIAEKMNLYKAGKEDHGFADFIEGVRVWLKQVAVSG